MAAERLDGFIDITIGAAQEGGILFFGGGDIVGGSFSWGPVHRESVAALRRRLVEKTKKQGGVFQVCRISLDKAQDASMPPAATDEAPRHVLRMLEEFLVIFETFYNGRREKGADFNSLIRKKFVDNAERFAFLDPFAGEFDFSERRIRFSGEAADRELATGIIVSTIELAREIGVEQELRKYLSSWRRKYDETLARLDVHIA
jgi:hypothetical protein